MAHLIKKTIKGKTYYYAEERERVNGKSKRKWQKYLGTLPKILAAVGNTPERPKHAEIFQLGASAAYLDIAKQINVISTIDSVLPKRRQGLSIGFYITLAAINRAIEPMSKRSMWGWFQNTILLRAFPQATEAALSSQRFWDNMSAITADNIQQAWSKLIHSILDSENIDLSNVAFDGTNFYTFISSFNVRCSLAKRGKNKQGRKDLRQVSYALFCTRKEHIPLYFEIYEGNKSDSKEFSIVIDKFFKAFRKYKPTKQGITIVFDKGNNSKDNFDKFSDGSGYHFVGSVKVSDHKDLSLISNKDKRLVPCDDPKLEKVKAHRIRKKAYDKDITFIATYNENLYVTQVASINNEINKCVGKLSLLADKLEARRLGKVKQGKKPTVASIKKQADSIRSGQYMKDLIAVEVIENNGLPIINYKLDNEAYDELADTYLGKNIIITDNHHWSTDEIILAYRSQYIIEDAFKHMKDRKTGSWWPMFHWTDSMIRVHGLYCSLSLLFNALLMKRAYSIGVIASQNRLHEKLMNIREVINVFSNNRLSVASKMAPDQKKLFELFKMASYMKS